MECYRIYLELKDKCKNFEYSVDRLYYTVKDMEDGILYYYSNLKRLIHTFLECLNNDRKKECISGLDKTVKLVRNYLENNPDYSLYLIYKFCSTF
jgi:hypothetical protein